MRVRFYLGLPFGDMYYLDHEAEIFPAIGAVIKGLCGVEMYVESHIHDFDLNINCCVCRLYRPATKPDLTKWTPA